MSTNVREGRIQSEGLLGSLYNFLLELYLMEMGKFFHLTYTIVLWCMFIDYIF